MKRINLRKLYRNRFTWGSLTKKTDKKDLEEETPVDEEVADEEEEVPADEEVDVDDDEDVVDEEEVPADDEEIPTDDEEIPTDDEEVLEEDAAPEDDETADERVAPIADDLLEAISEDAVFDETGDWSLEAEDKLEDLLNDAAKDEEDFNMLTKQVAKELTTRIKGDTPEIPAEESSAFGGMSDVEKFA